MFYRNHIKRKHIPKKNIKVNEFNAHIIKYELQEQCGNNICALCPRLQPIEGLIFSYIHHGQIIIMFPLFFGDLLQTCNKQEITFFITNIISTCFSSQFWVNLKNREEIRACSHQSYKQFLDVGVVHIKSPPTTKR